MAKTLSILGTRGVPARHGGFETFAEDLALYLVERGWETTVYGQQDGRGPIVEDQWRGVRRVTIPVSAPGAVGTIAFDWRATWHASRRPGPALVLGYNTAVFCAVFRLRGPRHLINMDGLEWKRTKYGWPQRAWLLVNEVMGAWIGNQLIADHPEIARHLARWTRPGKIATIPYGARPIVRDDPDAVAAMGLEPGGYALVIARPEPENMILPLVEAFSRRRRGRKLVVLGSYSEQNRYHAKVRRAASDEVHFPGAIYEKPLVEALRRHCRLYLHGHTVGGTNPSLVEALAAGSPVLAHDNAFNRWVAGPGAAYFADREGCARELERVLEAPEELERMREASRRRFREAFTLERCLAAYESLLSGDGNGGVGTTPAPEAGR